MGGEGTACGAFANTCDELRADRRRFLVTGGAGFIGYATARRLLELGQTVLVLDNFATGKQKHISELRTLSKKHGSFSFCKGDIRDIEICRDVAGSVDVIIHLAALGSVPRSIADPLTSHQVNVDGFVNILTAAYQKSVKRVVYASSSSVYGDHPSLPKRESEIGTPLSPYALTKAIDEQYAAMFARAYAMEMIGLRYFNVFGPHQDPDGPYAAVVPKWIAALRRGERVRIFGDGKTSRDFCYVENAVQSNILAACATAEKAVNQVYNIAVGQQTSLNELHRGIVDRLVAHKKIDCIEPPVYEDFRPGDVRHSLADVSKARELLGYQPSHSFDAGLDETIVHFAE